MGVLRPTLNALMGIKTRNITKYVRSYTAAKPTTMEKQIDINGQTINYLKIGTGSHVLLLYPALLGTIWTHYKPQIEGLDKERFTLVAWEPPGYGFSQPPTKQMTLDFQETDITYAYDLMNRLGVDTYSVLGWCFGGVSCIFMAAKYPEKIRKLVTWGVFSYVTPYEIDSFGKMSDTTQWVDKIRIPLSMIHTPEVFQKMYDDWYTGLKEIFEKRNGDVCQNVLHKVQCPSLIVHGRKDKSVDVQHSEYLVSNIKGAELKIFETSGHALHATKAKEFNEKISEFLLR